MSKLSIPILLIVILLRSFQSHATGHCPVSLADSIPSYLIGNFTDDYEIKYTISDSVWIQHPNVKYHVLELNVKDQYIIARNDTTNPSESGLYTRIDYMSFTGMKPWLWGFCFSVYNAASIDIARTTAQADRQNPKKGCNGFPFSRMK
jgi:hypothetical protein